MKKILAIIVLVLLFFDTTFAADKIKPKKYVFSVEHQNHYTSALRMFKDNIYTGIGPRMFRYVCGYDKYKIWEGCSTHPHNTYIQLLSETGLFGFIFGILIFLYVFLIPKDNFGQLFNNKMLPKLICLQNL